MTCIVGFRQGGKVIVGGDSAGISGWDVTVRADPKVFVAGDYVMGFTSSFRLGQLLQFRLKLPEPPRSANRLYSFMVAEFVEPSAPFAAIGSGAPYALGSLATSKGEPTTRVRQALAAAERFCIGVRGPFRVLAAPV
jgi:ATP-dependent protease HslVU (ClpYQ) peptidase subunit